ncbi:MAG: TonB family protein [Mariprofundaceae bacterium]|nr:TonB family protein [Mariprofundaceae bacterium]
MAASAAIHVAVLLWPGDMKAPVTPAAELVVEVSLTEVIKPAEVQKAVLQRPVESRVVASKVPDPEPQKNMPPAQILQATTRQDMALDSDHSARESLIRNHLERFKYYPSSARRRGIIGEVEVAFELNDRGEAGELKILSGSGYTVLDRAALKTVRRAEPFPADGGDFQFRLHFRAS